MIDSTEDEHAIDPPEEDNIEVNDKKKVQFTGSKIYKKRCTLVPIYTSSQLVHLLEGRGGGVDKIYLERQRNKKQITLVEKEIDDVHASNQDGLQGEDDSSKLDSYMKMIQQMQNLHGEGKSYKLQIEKLRTDVNQL